jgi:hypothetical protein
MRSPLEDLQALADQAATLPVNVSDVDTVHTLLSKAQDWLRKANNLASQVRIVAAAISGRLHGASLVLGLYCKCGGIQQQSPISDAQ